MSLKREFLSFFRYAESVGAKHYHTSAKLNKGIEELFLDLCKRTLVLVCLFFRINMFIHTQAAHYAFSRAVKRLIAKKFLFA